MLQFLRGIVSDPGGANSDEPLVGDRARQEAEQAQGSSAAVDVHTGATAMVSSQMQAAALPVPPMAEAAELAGAEECGATPADTATPPQLGHELCGGRVICTLRWQTTAGMEVDLELATYLAGCGGMYLGCVNGRLKQCAGNVEDQWKRCGIVHNGSSQTSPGTAREEVAELELDTLAGPDTELIQYIFLRVGLPVVAGDAGALVHAGVQAAVRDGNTLFQTEVVLEQAGGVVVALFVRDGQDSWFLAPAKVPCGISKVDGAAALDETIGQLAREADSRKEAHKRHSEDAAALQAVSEAIAASGEPTLTEEDQQLLEGIKVYVQNGQYSDAVDAQDILITRLLEYQDRDSKEGRWQALIERELNFMDELRKQERLTLPGAKKTRPPAARPGGSSSSIGASSPMHPQESQAPTMDVLPTPLPPHSQPPPTSLPPPPAPEASSLGSQTLLLPTRMEPAGAAGSKKMSPAPVPLVGSSTEDRHKLVFGPAPIDPCSGSIKGGSYVHWQSEEGVPEPLDMYINEKPCAALEGGVFVIPRGIIDAGAEAEGVTVRTVTEEREETLYLGAFKYWVPGEICSVTPSRGPLTGGREVRVVTTDLGESIGEVLLRGQRCELTAPAASSSEVVFVLPPSEDEGAVMLEVRAPNGNAAILDTGFTYFTPEVFGPIGDRIELSNEGRTVKRTEGVNGGICLGAYPLRRFPEGRYFEVEVEEVVRGLRALAVGVAAARPMDKLLGRAGRIREQEAKSLERVWLAGYDKGGSLFLSDGAESKIPTKTWRAVSEVKAGTRLGVLWIEPKEGAPPELVIFQDGEERVRLPAGGSVPAENEDLFALVDVQGSARQVTLLEGMAPPSPELEEAEGEEDEEAGTITEQSVPVSVAEHR